MLQLGKFPKVDSLIGFPGGPAGKESAWNSNRIINGIQSYGASV